jgi:hypothetical protein
VKILEAQPLRYLDAALLAVSGLLLSSLVPGGPIENRDFSHIPVAVLLGFNIFLTALAMGSIATAVGLLGTQARTRVATFWAAASYIVVYTADLLGWFPTSPTPMPPTLRAVEMAGIAVAVVLAWRSAHGSGSAQPSEPLPILTSTARAAMVLVAGLVIAFSTMSAMGSDQLAHCDQSNPTGSNQAIAQLHCENARALRPR